MKEALEQQTEKWSRSAGDFPLKESAAMRFLLCNKRVS
jgi:hypothetical protein